MLPIDNDDDDKEEESDEEEYDDGEEHDDGDEDFEMIDALGLLSQSSQSNHNPLQSIMSLKVSCLLSNHLGFDFDLLKAKWIHFFVVDNGVVRTLYPLFCPSFNLSYDCKVVPTQKKWTRRTMDVQFPFKAALQGYRCRKHH